METHLSKIESVDSPISEETGDASQNLSEKSAQAENSEYPKLHEVQCDPQKIFHFKNFLMWENYSNVCWLDSSMSLLVYNQNVRRILHFNPECQISKIIRGYDKAMMVLNDNLQSSSQQKILTAREILSKVQSAALDYLQPIVKYTKGEPDSAFCALYNLISEDKIIRGFFDISYAWLRECESCGARTLFEIKKPFITLSRVIKFKPDIPVSLCPCPACKEPGQKMQLIYKNLPSTLIYHFENGAGTDKTTVLKFTIKSRTYHLTGLMTLEKGQESSLNHFVYYVRNPSTNMWLECNDLNSEMITFSGKSPFVNFKDVYMIVYEALDELGTIICNENILFNNSPVFGQGNLNVDVPCIDITDEAIETEFNDQNINGNDELLESSEMVKNMNISNETSKTNIQVHSYSENSEIQTFNKEDKNDCFSEKEVSQTGCSEASKNSDFNRSPEIVSQARDADIYNKNIFDDTNSENISENSSPSKHESVSKECDNSNVRNKEDYLTVESKAQLNSNILSEKNYEKLSDHGNCNISKKTLVHNVTEKVKSGYKPVRDRRENPGSLIAFLEKKKKAASSDQKQNMDNLPNNPKKFQNTSLEMTVKLQDEGNLEKLKETKPTNNVKPYPNIKVVKEEQEKNSEDLLLLRMKQTFLNKNSKGAKSAAIDELNLGQSMENTSYSLGTPDISNHNLKTCNKSLPKINSKILQPDPEKSMNIQKEQKKYETDKESDIALCTQDNTMTRLEMIHKSNITTDAHELGEKSVQAVNFDKNPKAEGQCTQNVKSYNSVPEELSSEKGKFASERKHKSEEACGFSQDEINLFLPKSKTTKSFRSRKPDSFVKTLAIREHVVFNKEQSLNQDKCSVEIKASNESCEQENFTPKRSKRKRTCKINDMLNSCTRSSELTVGIKRKKTIKKSVKIDSGDQLNENSTMKSESPLLVKNNNPVDTVQARELLKNASHVYPVTDITSVQGTAAVDSNCIKDKPKERSTIVTLQHDTNTTLHTDTNITSSENVSVQDNLHQNSVSELLGGSELGLKKHCERVSRVGSRFNEIKNIHKENDSCNNFVQRPCRKITKNKNVKGERRLAVSYLSTDCQPYDNLLEETFKTCKEIPLCSSQDCRFKSLQNEENIRESVELTVDHYLAHLFLKLQES